jgi:hypothetical protein
VVRKLMSMPSFRTSAITMSPISFGARSDHGSGGGAWLPSGFSRWRRRIVPLDILRRLLKNLKAANRFLLLRVASFNESTHPVFGECFHPKASASQRDRILHALSMAPRCDPSS